MARCFLVAVLLLVSLSQCVKTETLDEIRAEARDEFNKIRTRMGLSTVRLDPDLNKAAQAWAKYLADSGEFHTKNVYINGKFGFELIHRQTGDRDARVKEMLNGMLSGDTRENMIRKGYTKFGYGLRGRWVGELAQLTTVMIFQK